MQLITQMRSRVTGRSPSGWLTKRKRRLRWLGLGLVGVIVPSVFTPLVGARASNASVVQTEVLSLDLTGNGTPGTGTVLERLELTGSGEMRVDVDTSLTEISGVAGSPGPRVDNGTVSYREGVNENEPLNVYFDGTATLTNDSGTVKTPRGDRQVPVAVDTTFRFNDQVVTDLDSIQGLSGTFEMAIMAENRSGTFQEVSYRDTASGQIVTEVGTVFIPMTVGMGPWYLDNANWQNLSVENGTLDKIGTTSVLTSAAVLFPPTTPGTQNLVFRGETNDFNLNSARVVVAPGIGDKQSDIVKAEQTQGASSLKTTYQGMQANLRAFDQLATKLPEFSDTLSGVITAGALLAAELTADLNTLVAGAENTIAALHTDLTQVQQILANLSQSLSGAVSTLGIAGATGAICKSVIDRTVYPTADMAALCQTGNSASAQTQTSPLPLLPPMPALNDIPVNFMNYGTGTIESGLRAKAGEFPTDMLPTPQIAQDKFLGSIWNWASLIYFGVQGAIDGDFDGAGDFKEFMWPDPDSAQKSIYSTQDLDAVVIRKGEWWHKDGTKVDPGFPDHLPPIAGICNMKDLVGKTDVKIDTDPSYAGAYNNPKDTYLEWTSLVATCADDIPQADVRMRDLIKSSDPIDPSGNYDAEYAAATTAKSVAETMIGTAHIAWGGVRAAGTAGGYSGGTTAYAMDIDFGEMLVQGSQNGIATALIGQQTVKGTPPTSFDIKCTVTGKVPSTDQEQNLAGAFCGKFKPTGAETGTRSTFGFRNDGPSSTGVATITGAYSFKDSVTGCYYPLSLFLPGGLSCTFAAKGQLGGLQAASQAIQLVTFNPTWNFDNWLRGDPGYQIQDAGTVQGPHLAQILNLLAFIIDRTDALCPATVVTSPPEGQFPGVTTSFLGDITQGTGTPRVKSPILDTPCDNVFPDTSNEVIVSAAGLSLSIKNDVVGALGQVIALLGNPSDPKFGSTLPFGLDSILAKDSSTLASLGVSVNPPFPQDVATALPWIASIVGLVLDKLIGGPDSTLGQSLTQAIDAMTAGVATATAGQQATELILGQVATQAIAEDLNTAVSKAGMKLAEEYEPFMGPATYGNGDQADWQVIISFEVQGTKPEAAAV